jgi:hypothetical protein
MQVADEHLVQIVCGNQQSGDVLRRAGADVKNGRGSNLGNRFGELAKTDGRNGGKIGKRGLLGSTRNIEPFPA